MEILSEALMSGLQAFQRKLFIPVQEGITNHLFDLAAYDCRNQCSGSCEGSCQGSCDNSCHGGCRGTFGWDIRLGVVA